MSDAITNIYCLFSVISRNTFGHSPVGFPRSYKVGFQVAILLKKLKHQQNFSKYISLPLLPVVIVHPFTPLSTFLLSFANATTSDASSSMDITFFQIPEFTFSVCVCLCFPKGQLIVVELVLSLRTSGITERYMT